MPKKSSELKSQASAKSTRVKDREAGASNSKPPSLNQPSDLSSSRPPNIVVSTSKLAASASSAQASGGGSSSTSRLTRRQTSILGAHLWFVERMTSVSRKKQVAKLAAETKLTEAQVEDWFKQNKPSKDGEKKKGEIQRKKTGDEKMSRVDEIPKTVEEVPKDVKAKVVTKGEKVLKKVNPSLTDKKDTVVSNQAKTAKGKESLTAGLKKGATKKGDRNEEGNGKGRGNNSREKKEVDKLNLADTANTLTSNRTNPKKVLSGTRQGHQRAQTGEGRVEVTIDDGGQDILSTAELASNSGQTAGTPKKVETLKTASKNVKTKSKAKEHLVGRENISSPGLQAEGSDQVEEIVDLGDVGNVGGTPKEGKSTRKKKKEQSIRGRNSSEITSMSTEDPFENVEPSRGEKVESEDANIGATISAGDENKDVVFTKVCQRSTPKPGFSPRTNDMEVVKAQVGSKVKRDLLRSNRGSSVSSRKSSLRRLRFSRLGSVNKRLVFKAAKAKKIIENLGTEDDLNAEDENEVKNDGSGSVEVKKSKEEAPNGKLEQVVNHHEEMMKSRRDMRNKTLKAINDIKKKREIQTGMVEAVKAVGNSSATGGNPPEVKAKVESKVMRSAVSKNTSSKKVGLVRVNKDIKAQTAEAKRLKEANKLQEKELVQAKKKCSFLEKQVEQLKKNHSACSVDLLMKKEELAAKEVKVLELQKRLKQAEKRSSLQTDKGSEVKRLKKELAEKEKMIKEKEKKVRKAVLEAESTRKAQEVNETESAKKLKEKDDVIELIQSKTKTTIELLKKQITDLEAEKTRVATFEERMEQHKKEKQALVEECKERTFQRMREKAAMLQADETSVVAERVDSKRKVGEIGLDAEVTIGNTAKRKRIVYSMNRRRSTPPTLGQENSALLSASMVAHCVFASGQVLGSSSSPPPAFQTSMVAHQVVTGTLNQRNISSMVNLTGMCGQNSAHKHFSELPSPTAHRVVEHLSVTKLSHNSMVAHLSPYPPTVQTRRTKVQSSQSLINDSGDVHSTCSPFLTTSVPTMPFPSSVAHAVNFVPQATITDLRIRDHLTGSKPFTFPDVLRSTRHSGVPIDHNFSVSMRTNYHEFSPETSQTFHLKPTIPTEGSTTVLLLACSLPGQRWSSSEGYSSHTTTTFEPNYRILPASMLTHFCPTQTTISSSTSLASHMVPPTSSFQALTSCSSPTFKAHCTTFKWSPRAVEARRLAGCRKRKGTPWEAGVEVKKRKLDNDVDDSPTNNTPLLDLNIVTTASMVAHSPQQLPSKQQISMEAHCTPFRFPSSIGVVQVCSMLSYVVNETSSLHPDSFSASLASHMVSSYATSLFRPVLLSTLTMPASPVQRGRKRTPSAHECIWCPELDMTVLTPGSKKRRVDVPAELIVEQEVTESDYEGDCFDSNLKADSAQVKEVVGENDNVFKKRKRISTSDDTERKLLKIDEEDDENNSTVDDYRRLQVKEVEQLEREVELLEEADNNDESDDCGSISEEAAIIVEKEKSGMDDSKDQPCVQKQESTQGAETHGKILKETLAQEASEDRDIFEEEEEMLAFLWPGTSGKSHML